MNGKLADIRAVVARHAERRRTDYPNEEVPDWAGYHIDPAEILTILEPLSAIPIFPPRPGISGTCEGCWPEGNEAGRAAL